MLLRVTMRRRLDPTLLAATVVAVAVVVGGFVTDSVVELAALHRFRAHRRAVSARGAVADGRVPMNVCRVTAGTGAP
ncbi:hypothetical protein [Nocardia terpenica]|uniref:Uncharacterized protein n=1 Tax=Nocardia terpenica TaxID=455432 RepID=A0A161XD89_9NOCA|nr:hypothetical protein [Nocardia terpenica]KZM71258.1 hypothetical protein AWN90_00260 [Nocardia terpenica]NQE90390.1 hypothetical protein [Nocardia terpenica]